MLLGCSVGSNPIKVNGRPVGSDAGPDVLYFDALRLYFDDLRQKDRLP